MRTNRQKEATIYCDKCHVRHKASNVRIKRVYSGSELVKRGYCPRCNNIIFE